MKFEIQGFLKSIKLRDMPIYLVGVLFIVIGLLSTYGFVSDVGIYTGPSNSFLNLIVDIFWPVVLAIAGVGLIMKRRWALYLFVFFAALRFVFFLQYLVQFKMVPDTAFMANLVLSIGFAIYFWTLKVDFT